MPKITFINLPEEKKQTLIAAMRKEFSRVPLYDASISNIVKSANIPRGSFYQYFEDKEDAFFFLLNDLVIHIRNNFIILLKKYDGDLFPTMIEFYQHIIMEEEDVHFLKNAFLNMTYKIELSFSKIFRGQEHSGNLSDFLTNLNMNNLNISNQKELFHLLQIVFTITLRNVVEKFAKDLSNQEALANYKMEMNLLKSGLIRKDS
ncbi:TetR family transcriptional regulator [Bacillus sp. AFS076308]|uniref:TetR/AcrR family transcriptional regulator n=1 Tax=unclassified Bacillus (in: firmicutes) TaxID=185979 RepID=UPI000BF50AD6|nr:MULTISPECIES: TetR/AcrR family transcriptional regulator [unclassified Bacillus (in: firmicutes)]PFN74835.1 TetR family transcriptional regulator [Bacillus sp. AFS076308]PGV50926.1 TetR family transcriptional regulator [Bacillus sp. AFS037270]